MARLVSSSHDFAAWIQTQPWAAVIFTFLAVCITTRLITGRDSASETHTSNAKTAPPVPYWFPYLGHVPQILLKREAFLSSLKKAYPSGAFSLNILGRTYTVFTKPSLIKSLLSQSPKALDTRALSKRVLQTVFAYPRSTADLALYDKFYHDSEDQYKHLSSEESLNLTVDATATRLRHNIAEFITFNSGEIDQTPWERTADASLVEDAAADEDVVEADLFELVRNFVAITANAALLGTDFVENFPQFWQALWRLDKGFLPLAMETPALLPVNSAIGARRARGFLLGWMDEFESALDSHHKGESPGPKWADLDNVSPIMNGRLQDVWLKHGVDIQQRSSLDLSLIWDLNNKVAPLIFWVIWRIYADPWLLVKIREEIEPYVVLEKPAVGFGGAFESATRIESIDIAGLLDHCPYLKASYIESMRLDLDSWDLKPIKEDTVITDKDGASGAFLLRAGTYAVGASSLHYTDAAAYEDPLSWKPERHIKKSGTDDKGVKRATVTMENLGPYTQGENLGQGKDFAIREIVLFTAAIIAMYDIQPAHGGPWKMPKQNTTVGAKHPVTATRMWIKSRPTPESS